MEEFYRMLGVAGAAFYLISYGALQTGLLRAETYRYSLLNLLASGFVLVSLAGAFNLGSMLTNMFWIILSIVGMVRLWYLTRNRKRSGLDEHFAAARLQGFSEPNVQRLLRSGTWRDCPAGEVLAREGEPIGHLYFLATGRAEVTLGHNKIAEILAPSYIGEQTALSGAPATATVTLMEDSTLLDIDAMALRATAERNTEFRSDLQRSIALDSMHKLSTSNAFWRRQNVVTAPAAKCTSKRE